MTFGQLPIGARFAFADSPRGDPKVKTGFARWKWDGHVGFLPVAVGCRADREVIELPKATREPAPVTLDPILAQLHAAAIDDPSACGPLADLLEELGHPKAARLAREYEAPDLAIAEYRGWKYGFFSARASEQVGAATWLDQEGKEVLVTMVAATMAYAAECNWSDMEYVGKVTECVKRSDGGLWGRRIYF